MEEEGSMHSPSQDEQDELAGTYRVTMDVEEEDEEDIDAEDDNAVDVDSNAPDTSEIQFGEEDGKETQATEEEEEEEAVEGNLKDEVKDNNNDGEGESPSKSESKEEGKDDEKAEPEKSQEKDVGITQYAGNHDGFFGIVKQRYSDFLVNEVNSSGEIVCITEQMVPHEPEEIPAVPTELPPELTPEKIQELNKLVGIKEPVRLAVDTPPKKEDESEETCTSDKITTDEPKQDENQAIEGQEMQEKEEKIEPAAESEDSVGQDGENVETVEIEKHEVEEKEVEAKVNTEQDDASCDVNEAVGEQQEENGLKTPVEEESLDKTKITDLNKKNKKKNKKDSDAPVEVLINVDSTDKEGRTAIHRAVKAKYRVVDSIYKEMEDGGKYIVVRKKKAGSVRRERTTWPKSQMYTTFVLYKENIDTMEAINHIAWKTRVKPNNFGYAGTKDKRAKTSQLVSVSRVPPHKLWHATKNHRGIELGNFRFRPTPQKLGQHRGNHFRIVLREVRGSDEVINSAVETLKTAGFINYYGSQRFGTTSIPTHTIGKELLKSNWQQAVNLILAPRENDIQELNRCRTTWKDTGDAEAALRSLPKGWESSVEAQLLTGLVQLQRNDLVGALDRIPRNTRLLYLHAYQSYLWNAVASRRIQKYGLKVLPGDIIRKKGDTVEEELPVTTPFSNEGTNSEKEKVGTHWWNAEVTKAVQEKKEAYFLKMQTEGVSEEEQKERQKRYQEAKQRAKKVVRESKRKAEEELGKYWAKLKTLPPEAVEEESNDDNTSDGENIDLEAKAEIEGEDTHGHKTTNIHFLTEEEAETADILDVLLPLPGYNVEYPNNEIKEWYSELLDADGLSFTSLKHRVKSYAVGGVYRRLIVRPTNVTGTVCYYKDASKPLVQSDMDKLRDIEVKDNLLTEGPYKALVLEMTLPSSSYATVALRELLKMDTSSQFQATLNSPVTYSQRKRGTPRGRGGPWRGPDRRGSWEERGSWKHQGFRGSWRGHDNSGLNWRQGRGGGRGSFQTRGDFGSYRGGREYGWNSGRGGGNRGGYGGGGGWGGRGNKRSNRGGDNWNTKRARYY
ncbi:uncharacterized protein [Panulirus ornatus]|uniref:uncharacterized protein isoform X2 n=1 Tax=Panulirus ornatus TaxID=150431 RepID=UPI003A8BFF77